MDVALSTAWVQAAANVSAAAASNRLNAPLREPGTRSRVSVPVSSTSPVASPKIVSPSNIECTGRMARAMPSCATEANLPTSAFDSAADVATTPIVVFRLPVTLPASGGRGRGAAWPSSTATSASRS